MRVLLALLLCGSAYAGTLADKFTPHIGQPVKIATGGDVLSATLKSSTQDHFCAVVHIPDFEQERCYSMAVVSYVTLPSGDRGLWIAVQEPRAR